MEMSQERAGLNTFKIPIESVWLLYFLFFFLFLKNMQHLKKKKKNPD